MNILNAKIIIIQIFQLEASMCCKQHCLETIYHIPHIWISHKTNVLNRIWRMKKTFRMTCLQIRGRWVERD